MESWSISNKTGRPLNPRMMGEQMTPVMPSSTGQGFELLAAESLNVDFRYQRHPNKAHVNKIAREFNPAIFGTITVSRREDSKDFILDGQHRIEGIKKAGKGSTRVPCVVHTGLSYNDEALMFYEMNSLIRPMTAQEKMKGAVESGDASALAIKATVEAAGFRLELESSDLTNGGIPGVGVLTSVAKNYRDDHLSDVLKLIAETWGTATGPRATLIDGTAIFISFHRDSYDRRRFVKQLHLTTPDALTQRASEVHHAMGIATNSAVAMQLVDHYNKRLSRINQLPQKWNGDGR